jgi:hypothetical protein
MINKKFIMRDFEIRNWKLKTIYSKLENLLKLFKILFQYNFLVPQF